MYRRSQMQPCLSSFTCILLLCTWSFGGEWPLSPLGNNLLLRSELVPIHEWWVYFPWPSHWIVLLRFGRGLAQVLDSIALAHCELEARFVYLQVIIIFSFLYIIMHAGFLCIYACVLYSITIILTCMAFIDMTHIYTIISCLHVGYVHDIQTFTTFTNFCQNFGNIRAEYRAFPKIQ